MIGSDGEGEVGVSLLDFAVEVGSGARPLLLVSGLEIDDQRVAFGISMYVTGEVTRLVSSIAGRVMVSLFVKARVTLITLSFVKVAVGPGTSTVCSTTTVIVEVVSFVNVWVLNYIFSSRHLS